MCGGNPCWPLYYEEEKESSEEDMEETIKNLEEKRKVNIEARKRGEKMPFFTAFDQVEKINSSLK